MSHPDDSAHSGPDGADTAPGAARQKTWWDGAGPVFALLAFQILCTLIILWDFTLELWEAGWNLLIDPHLAPELFAVLGLGLSTAFVVRVLQRMRARQARLEKGLSVAAGALSGLIESYFTTWALTVAEQDVATFTIKGYSIAEIARLRGSAEGTIKTHLNAIYRKAGVSGRAQLTSLLVEDLMRAPLMGAHEDVSRAQRVS